MLAAMWCKTELPCHRFVCSGRSCAVSIRGVRILLQVQAQSKGKQPADVSRGETPFLYGSACRVVVVGAVGLVHHSEGNFRQQLASLGKRS